MVANKRQNKTGRQEVRGSTNSEPGKIDNTTKINSRDYNDLSRRDTTDREIDELIRRVTESPQHVPNQIGKYLKKKEIGRGGFGVVFLFLDTELHREVAIKIPRQMQGARETLERFLKEAQIGAGFEHPNIPTVYDYIDEDGICGIVSEYVPGVDLRDWVHNNSLSHKEIVQILTEIADALEFAHSKGIVHLDIKPSNIRVNESGKPHVLDFGLSVVTSQARTDSVNKNVQGTVQYIAPERWDRKKNFIGDDRSDIYSFGAMMYELLTEHPVHEGPTLTVMKAAINHTPKPFPEQLQICGELEDICFHCLEKKPTNRYQSMECVRKELVNWLSSADSTSMDFDWWLFRIAGWYSQKTTQAKIAIGAITFSIITSILISAWPAPDASHPGLDSPAGLAQEIERPQAAVDIENDKQLYNIIAREIGLGSSQAIVEQKCQKYLFASSSPVMKKEVEILLKSIRASYDETIQLSIHWGKDYGGWDLEGGNDHKLTVFVDNKKVKVFDDIESTAGKVTRLKSFVIANKIGELRELKVDLIEVDLIWDDILGGDKADYVLNDNDQIDRIFRKFSSGTTITYRIKAVKHSRSRLKLPPWKAR